MTVHKIIRVQVLEAHRLHLSFDDGKSGTVDLSRLVGKGVFSCWADDETFKKVRIGESGELLWNDQVDLCPDALYLEVTRQRPEDIFPSLKRQASCA